jgi:hypothetical protein
MPPRSVFFTFLLASFFVLAGCQKTPKEDPPANTARAETSATRAGLRVADAAVTVEKVEVPEVRIKAKGATTVRVTWLTPPGTGVNDDAPFRVRWNRSDGLSEAPADFRSNGGQVKSGFHVQVQPMPGAPNATLAGDIDIVVCDDATHSVCVPVRRSVELGFVAANDAHDETTVSIPLPAAK